MATIPIEITIQDQASPITPTPSTNTDTNITVPDTGAGMVGSNNTSSSSSVASIILPAILLMAALATICTVLIHKHRKHQDNNNKTTKKEKLITATSTTIAVLSATVLVGNLVIPATNAATSVVPGTADLEVADKITITATREADSDEVVATVKNTSYATANLDFGYKVTASMAEGLTTANLYLDGDETSEYYIAPAVDGTLTDNTWGYTLSEEAEEYSAIPLADTPATIAKGNDAVEDKAVDMYYTVKISNDMPSGTYKGELEYTIAPAAEYMQDFATMAEEEKTATLANMPEGKQYILKDIRDKKSYYISRLADGNVWMTQNLDLDLNENTTLTPADTDVSENWTPVRSTINFTGTEVDGWQVDNNTPYSANPGDVYYYTSGTNADDTQYNSLAECEAVHDDGTCQHYQAGNYYNWPAAVASNNTEEMTEQYYNASDSICPAGWRLPEGKNNESPTSGNELISMINSLGNILGEYSPSGPPGGAYSYLEGGFINLRINPIWLVRSGDIPSGQVSSKGQTSAYSTKTLYGGTSVYSSRFFSYGVGAAMYSQKSYGNTIRCLTR